jgi:hypothetical protein
MVFVETAPSGTFVAWGEEKARENSFVVKQGESLTGMILQIKDSPKYGFILEIKSKQHEDPLIVLGTMSLISKMGFQKNENGVAIPIKGKEHIKEEDVVRITFLGMVPTKRGKQAYDFKVEVDK